MNVNNNDEKSSDQNYCKKFGSSSSNSSHSGDNEEIKPTLASLNIGISHPGLVPSSSKSQEINDQKQLALMKKTGYNMIQRNGQRIYGGPPPGWQGPPPCKGTEIFVGKVPRDMLEWELVPIFEMVII